MTLQKISILGCGWLGLPLAKHYIAQGIAVHGTTTTASKIETLQQAGITPYLLTLGSETVTPAMYTDFLADSEVLVINFPPKRIPNIIAIYQQQIQELIPYIPAHQKVIFISSTSVYQNTNAVVSESLAIAPEKESGKAVAAVEQLLRTALQDRLTIIRLSGLIGDDRLPGRFLANKKEVKNGDAPINVIHREDCIGVIDAVITQEAWGHIINGSADEHPLRKDFYTLAAQKIGLTPPAFAVTPTVAYKIISNTKSKELLGYTYVHPDPLKLI